MNPVREVLTSAFEWLPKPIDLNDRYSHLSPAGDDRSE